MEKLRAIPEGYMRIGEIAKKAGVTVRTLQYYDTEGLISPSAESEGGFRLYTNKDMVRLIQILMMKQLGFPLGEIKKRLTQLDTPEDVRMMLAEQAAHIRKKIEILAESVDVMEALSAEISQMEAVNFKKYADILLYLQMKNEGYRMIKHFDDEMLDIFRERIGREKAALMTAALHGLYDEAVELLAQAVLPESESGQKFAARFWETLVELSGGDMALMLKMSEQLERASSFEKDNDDERRLVRHFMKQALEILHIKQEQSHPDGMNLDMKQIFAVFFKLYNKAARLVKEAVLPESEEGQKFADILWQTLVKFSGGDTAIMREMSAQMEKAFRTNNNDDTRMDVHHFMQHALEFYHNKHSKGDM